MKKIAQQTQALLQLTSSLLVQTHIKSVICRADALGLDHDNLVKLPQSLNIQNLILVTHDRRLGELLKRSSQRTITIPEVELTRRGEARAALAIVLLNGWVKDSERVVFLSGPPRSRVLDTLFVLRPNHELQIAHAPSLKVFSKRMMPEVFETLIRIALELAHEGREGRPVGTMFVLGDTANVLKYAQPMVLNPFKGYADSKKNIPSSRRPFGSSPRWMGRLSSGAMGLFSLRAATSRSLIWPRSFRRGWGHAIALLLPSPR
jgi:diadenylate cyclase